VRVRNVYWPYSVFKKPSTMQCYTCGWCYCDVTYVMGWAHENLTPHRTEYCSTATVMRGARLTFEEIE
jgi:hypothetical protein